MLASEDFFRCGELEKTIVAAIGDRQWAGLHFGTGVNSFANVNTEAFDYGPERLVNTYLQLIGGNA